IFQFKPSIMENQNQNIVRLTGCAGNAPVVSNFSNNKKVARLSMAVNESYRTLAGEEVKKTQWFNLVFWGAKVEAAEQLIKKGTRFSIVGKLQNNVYQA